MAGEAGTAARGEEGAKGCQSNHDKIKGIGGEKTEGGGANELNIEDKQECQQKRYTNGETRKRAGRQHGDLTLRK